MTDLNKEREAFEKLSEIAEILNEEKSHFNGDFYDLPFNSCAESFINGAWYAWQEKAKAQAVPEGFKIVPIELSEEIAERLALERVQKPRPENDPVWVEIAERAYKSNLLAKKWELVREYKILTEASESGAEQ
ncbi:Uncharacterised protein [Acinetobacter nosocomialis]|uniref:hypothetical protein n=1 Tax=Acinetobacter nosocomialis TaxID=106654 RepID=UPI000DE777F2|nr:hypothetical protein [Acinetobacter nosocomialis]SSR13740.1 Uncharacterised protein [Acinetobacter nosocomialis]